MEEFKPGDRVRMKYYIGECARLAYGEVTIVTKDSCKIIFDGDFDLNYWYYPKENLELVEKKNNA